MDYTKVEQYSETLCQIVSQIVQAELKTVKFDKSIRCSIVDATKKDYGYYTVSDNATQYIAYSKDGVEYKTGDSVYVTIPNGDVDEQKFIIGKAYGEVEPDYFPLKNFLSAEEWNTPKKSDGTSYQYAIEANGSEQLIAIPSEQSGERESRYNYEWVDKLNLRLLGGRDITHLAISANFSTALPTCRKGVFGIKAQIIFINTKNTKITKEFYFLSPEMYGTIYQLKEVNQKYILSFSALNIQKITSLKFWLYQQNDFFDCR